MDLSGMAAIEGAAVDLPHEPAECASEGCKACGAMA